MFSGRVGRFSATAANPSLIAVSCPSSSRYHRTRSRNLTRLPTPLAVSLHRVVGGAGLLHPRVSLLAAVWVCIALGATGRDRGGGRTTPCRRARHAGLRNAPPPDSRLLARHDCACVRPTLNRGAVEVLTEGSNYRGRRITYVGRKPSVDRALLLGRAELARARPRTRPGRSLGSRMSASLHDSDIAVSRLPGSVHLAVARVARPGQRQPAHRRVTRAPWEARPGSSPSPAGPPSGRTAANRCSGAARPGGARRSRIGRCHA